MIEKLQVKNILQKNMTCKKSGANDFKLVKRKRNKKGRLIYSWRCSQKNCNVYVSVNRDIFGKIFLVHLIK